MNLSNAADTGNRKAHHAGVSNPPSVAAVSASKNDLPDLAPAASSHEGGAIRRSSYLLCLDGQQHDVSNLAVSSSSTNNNSAGAGVPPFQAKLMLPSGNLKRKSYPLYPDLQRVEAAIEAPDQVCHNEHDAFMAEWTQQWLKAGRSASLSYVRTSSSTAASSAAASSISHDLTTVMPRSTSAPIHRTTTGLSSRPDADTTEDAGAIPPPGPLPRALQGNPKRSGSTSSSEASAEQQQEEGSRGSNASSSSTMSKLSPKKIAGKVGDGVLKDDALRRQLALHQQLHHDHPAYLRADLDDDGKPVVEIGNVKVPYVGSTSRTKAAIRKNKEPTVALDCPNCRQAIVCIAGLRYVLCASCKTVSSAQRYHRPQHGLDEEQPEPYGVGVGLVRPADYTTATTTTRLSPSAA